MSDSDAPTKKAAAKAPTKKTAKKAPAKKAVTKATDAVLADTGEQVLAQVHESIEREIADGLERGIPAIRGACTVSLHLDVADATTPIEAVQDAMLRLITYGSSTYSWVVTDETTGDTHIVQNGRILDLSEVSRAGG